MTDILEPGPADAAAELELNRLNAQVAAMRAVLVQLLQDVVRAEKRLDEDQAEHLMLANEQLLINALGARSEAQSATGNLTQAAWALEHDALTGLPNRTLLMDRLGQAIGNAKRRGTRLAVLFVDLNDFKQINDLHGHATGDRALQLAAECMTSLVRETDTVSRHGGDEFVIVLAEISQPVDASRVAAKLNIALRARDRIDDRAVSLAASIGISLYPEDGGDAATLIDRADAAMYTAKSRALGGFEFYTDQSAVRPSKNATASRPATEPSLTEAEHERRHALLREANEQLVLAALGAQELQAAAEAARLRHTQLLDSFARELSDPFAPIRIAASMVGRPDVHAQLLPRALAIVDQQMDRIAGLVAAIVEPPLPNADGTQRTVIDLREVAANALNACRPTIDGRRQVTRVEVPQTPVEVCANAAQIEQALTNLVNTATNYPAPAGFIGLAVSAADGVATVTVTDNGMGIAPESLSTIMDPFVRDPRASAADHDALGVGLTVVRSVIEAHGGRVVASSPGMGQGSRFTVTLPTASSAAGV